MSLSSEPANNTSGRLTSPDLRLRTSTALWGPLQLTLVNHREGVELGYRAGENAYEEYGQDHGAFSEEALSMYMTAYLASPSYRPRAMTNTILAEWKAMFVLGWTGRMLERSSLARTEAPGFRSEEYRPTRHAAYGTRSARNKGEE